MTELTHLDELPAEHASSAAKGEAVLIVSILTSLLRRRRLILLSVAVAAALAAALVLARGSLYTVATTFIPQEKGGVAGGLAGFAAQLGVAVAGDGADQSPSFYVDLVQTRAILGSVIDSSRTVADSRVRLQVRLADFLRIRAGDSLYRRDLAIEALRRAVTVAFSQRTGVIRVAVTLSSAAMAKDVVEQIVRELMRFNLNKRQGQAGAERRFAEQRLAQTAAELRLAEGREQDFLLHNGEFRSAPQLQFEYDRLSREVSLRQQLYVTLAQTYERAKIDEVRDTPLITQIERPEIPPRPDDRGLLRWIALSAFLGAFAGSALALFLDYLAAHETDADVRRDFVEARRATVADLRRPWRLLRNGTKR